MNNHSMKSPLSTKPNRYQSFYMKKLQTQTSLSSGIQQTSKIIQKQIQKIQRDLYKRNSLYNKTLTKKSRLDQQQQRSRTDLKSRIEQKMRKSHNNMLEYRQKSSTSLSTRRKAEHQKIQQIKRLQKTIYNQKYQKAKQLSNRTQKFFQQLNQKKKKRSQQISVDTSYMLTNRKVQPLFSPISNKYLKHRQSMHERSHHKLQQNPESYHHNRSNLSILRTPQQSIIEKQKKKTELQKVRENSFLRDYVQKLQCIQAARKNVKVSSKVPEPTVAKIVNRQISSEEVESRKKFSKSYVKEAVENKNSFSQMYKKKIQEKKQKKSFFMSQSIAEGDLILKDNFRMKSRLKINKLIRDTQNQLTRKENLRYMEKYLARYL